MARRPASPGGVGDGLPALPDGEPLLQRWFVIAMVVLVVGALGVTTWAFLSISRERIPVAERRPPGTATVTHERGDARLNTIEETAPGPACAADIEVFGDEGARAAGDRVLRAVCRLLDEGDFTEASIGRSIWVQSGGQLRIAVFEVTGLESSARVEGGRVVIELSPRFQFTDAAVAAPLVLHELVHIAGTWPGTPVTAEQELEAMRTQRAACDLLPLDDELPRGCADARALTDLEPAQALQRLEEAGYGAATSRSPS